LPRADSATDIDQSFVFKQFDLSEIVTMIVGQKLRQLLSQLIIIGKPLFPALAMSIPLMILQRISNFVLPAAIKYLVDDILINRKTTLLHLFLLVTGLASIVQGATTQALANLVGRSHERLLAELRAKMQAHIVSLPLSFHESRKTGSLVSSIMEDMDGFPKFFSAGIMEAGGAALGAGVIFLVLFRIQPIMACTNLTLVVLHAIISLYAVQKVRKKYEDHQQTRAEVIGRLNETLAGVRIVKAYNAESHEHRVFGEGAQRIFRKHMAALMTTERLRMMSISLTGIGSAAVLYYGAWKVLSGELTLGGLITFSVSIPLLMAPINQMAGLVPQLSQALAGVKRSLNFFSVAPESHSPTRTVRVKRLDGKISFKNVSFGYVPGRPILHDISFEAEPGTITALVGRSGAGKSTIAALIASLYEPDKGTITVDDISLSTVRYDSYRSQLGIVLQDTFLFDGTIVENVAFSRAGSPESHIKDVISACKFAGVDEFAEQMPEKYQTIVGERGIKLSGGQRQRIAIARAILANPRILILDEPTSSLDIHAEEQILTALKALMVGRTTFIIAHRMSLFRSADQILVIENGRICERGTHDSLFAGSGKYRAFGDKSYAGLTTPDLRTTFSLIGSQK